MRRLPIFFVLDCSESMIGESLSRMEQGLQSIIRSLRRDPHALESVFLSVIAFAGIAKTIAPLIEVVSFYPPKLPIGGGTSLGEALLTLMAEIDKTVIRTTSDRKGDWRPIVYLFTDGRPTDAIDHAIEQWNAKYAKRVTLVAVGLGLNADLAVLKRLTDNVLLFENSAEEDFHKFIAWVTASIVVQSRSVGDAGDAPALPALLDQVVKLVKDTPPPPPVDEQCVVLVGRCQKVRKPYLMKYERIARNVGTAAYRVEAAFYEIGGCFPVDEEYFAWSDAYALDIKVNSASLHGAPGCPHCGNGTAFAQCHCGKLLCIAGPGEAHCPWCRESVFFRDGPGDEAGFDVTRGRG